MDSEFETTDQPAVARRQFRTRPVPTAVVILLTLASFAAAPVGFFAACTASLVVIPEVFPHQTGDDSLMVIGIISCAGALLLTALIFGLFVWPQWRKWSASRAAAQRTAPP